MTRLIRILFTYILYAVFTLKGVAQNIVFDPFTSFDLKEFGGRINCFYQDHLGFIWIGKETGLYRFDGFQLKQYHFNTADSTTIGSDNITTVAGDKKGNLWVGTKGGGLNRFDYGTGKFKRFLHHESDPKTISYNEVFTIVPDKKGNFWIGTDGGGFCFFNPKTERFKNYQQKSDKDIGLKSNKILSIQYAQNGTLLLGTWGGGLHLFDPATDEITHLGYDTPFDKCNVFSIAEVEIGIYWLATWGQGLVEYNSKLNRFASIIPAYKTPYLRCVFVDKRKQVWVGSASGLIKFSSSKSSYSLIDEGLSPFQNVTSLYYDNFFTMWVGSETGSVGKIYSTPKKFLKPPKSLPFASSSINFILGRDNQGLLWFAAGNVLYRYHPNSNEYKGYPSLKSDLVSLADFPERNSIVCASSTGLSIFNKSSDRFEKMVLDSGSNSDLLTRQIWTVSYIDSLNYWIGALGGAYTINFNTQKNNWVVGDVYLNGLRGSLSANHYPSCFLKNESGDFWVGTWGGGLNFLPYGSKVFSHILSGENIEGISTNFIECLTKDNLGNIWAGTHTGLAFSDRTNSLLKSYNVANGLINSYIVSIGTDDQDNIWAGTQNGMIGLTGNRKNIKNFDQEDGLPGNTFMPRSVIKDDSGILYFGTSRGLFWFHPDSLFPNTFVPVARITEFRIQNKLISVSDTSVLHLPIESTKEIHLACHQSTFSFQLAALSYVNPKKNLIKYMLKGYDKDWRFAGTNHLATYEDVPSGRYLFSVITANSDGVWSNHETSLRLIIALPWFLSTPAIIGYLLAMVTGFIGFISYKSKKKNNPTLTDELSSHSKKNLHKMLQPSEVILESSEKQFLQRAIKSVEDNISDSDFGVDEMCSKMGISRPQLYRKIHAIADVSITEFIKEIRLKRAVQLLRQKPESISEIAYKVGFNDPKYFSKCFKQQFGISPAQFIIDPERFLPS